MHFSNNDTIVALATPAGTGAIGVIRLSGEKAFDVAGKVFSFKKSKSKKIAEQKSHTIHFGNISDGSRIIDEVLVSIFKSPHSYTGEDIVEISCHGSSFIQQKILSLLINAGARPAQPGEFTLQAFLNGKLDLSQAEAVADLIASSSESSHRIAMQQMRGGFSTEIKNLRKELVHFASLIELELDFGEEDVEFADRKQLKDLILNLQASILKLVKSFELGNVIRRGVPVVIAGKPNSGKSTLLNAFVNDDRAIVSHIAGTTRDTIEEEIVLDGILFRFIDTAGLRETTDFVENLGVNKTLEKLKQSKVLIYLFDVNELKPAELKNILGDLQKSLSDTMPYIIPVANKIDETKNGWQKDFSNIERLVGISAKNKTHLDELKDNLTRPFKNGEFAADETTVSNIRHYDALVKTNASLQKVMEGIDKKITHDFIALDIRHALNYLGEITGEISTDDLLENIFSKFCIGK
ncbi:MAG TPA: tRNA uridine-5-carboxymethylaminomethyl(34) synthesis GTPase MnmE [Bacteroidia bacterium]|nr:tRNA uridine-5-carboxymethylaminomethyl(34) synthesis GTPase MnmE [Bacteroidia bacterium]